MQPDIIEGRVVRVVGTSTIDIEVLRTDPHNRLDYGPSERVRMTMTKARGLASDDGSPRERVVSALDGREVKVRVHARDEDNMVLGDVEVLA